MSRRNILVIPPPTAVHAASGAPFARPEQLPHIFPEENTSPRARLAGGLCWGSSNPSPQSTAGLSLTLAPFSFTLFFLTSTFSPLAFSLFSAATSCEQRVTAAEGQRRGGFAPEVNAGCRTGVCGRGKDVRVLFPKVAFAFIIHLANMLHEGLKRADSSVQKNNSSFILIRTTARSHSGTLKPSPFRPTKLGRFDEAAILQANFVPYSAGIVSMWLLLTLHPVVEAFFANTPKTHWTLFRSLRIKSNTNQMYLKWILWRCSISFRSLVPKKYKSLQKKKKKRAKKARHP